MSVIDLLSDERTVRMLCQALERFVHFDGNNFHFINFLEFALSHRGSEDDVGTIMQTFECVVEHARSGVSSSGQYTIMRRWLTVRCRPHWCGS